MTTRSAWRLFITALVMLMCLPTGAAAGVLLKLGDVLAAEPGTSTISVIDPVTGVKTIIATGGLLSPLNKIGSVAFAPDGDLIVAHRTAGLLRVNPATGAVSVQSQGGHLRDPWAVAIDKNTGFIYVADSGYDNDRAEINEAGKIIRVHPVSGAQEVIAAGSPCTVFPTGVACQNTNSAGSYLTHPYGVAVNYTTSPTTLVVADMGSFNGKGAIVRIQPVVGGAQTLLWGPASAPTLPQVVQASPLGCPMGVAVEPTGNILATAFTFPVPAAPTMPSPAGTYYGCAPPGIFRVNLGSNVQTVLNANAPAWLPNQAYALGSVIHDQGQHRLYRVVGAGVSQSTTPAWNGTPGSTTVDGSVTWRNIGIGANWSIPFGVAVEPAPTAANPSAYNIIVGDEGHRMVFRLGADGGYLAAPLAAEVSNVTSVNVITITPAGGFKTIPNSPPGSSNFIGTESPLSQGGMWDSPGSWADLQVNNGAYAVGLNAQGRLVTPAVAANQYSEITYDQDPGAGNWVGVGTRIQSATNGSGYLAIAYAGEVRLYRIDDAGGQNFTLLASASAPVGTAPRRLRLESQGNIHRVFFNGAQLINHTATGTTYSSGQPGIAASVFGGPTVKILTFVGGSLGQGPVDLVPPFRYSGQPTGPLAAGATQTTMSLTTDENATCRYAAQAGVAYASMTSTFATTGATAHSTVVNGLSSGQSYQFFVRCIDAGGNANTDDFLISFSVQSPNSGSSTFGGVENPLSQGGIWDSPGTWADLRVSNGAYAVGLNAQGRLVTPAVAANQYSEITYDQDPGAGSSWVGVGTRIQSATNGSGYLAIAYAGEVRLYRTDDTGSLNFTLLASASASVGTAPRRLRLESQGNTHRVFFNGAQLINHTATGTTYSSGQPGIAASVFGGPTVKILTFVGGSLGQGPVDLVPPFRYSGQPTGPLAAGATQTTMSLTTDENATCRYAAQAGVAYASMTSTFATTGATAHSTVVNGLSSGQSYQFFVRCIDAGGNGNTDDFVITFSVPSSTPGSSTFGGVENPLSQGGMWDSPGSWADLQVNNGAYAVGLNAQGRLVTPAVAANQYSEITYDQDPGAGNWVGVGTRIQSATNGSGYLAIAYAGEVRLYRIDDAGGQNFTLLASASASVGTAPRRLRLESQGNTHRVFFNGAQLINHTATGTTYSSGQPGIAASVFGGPTVKILTFVGGSLGQGPVDLVPPFRYSGQPTGPLAAGATQTTMSLTTDENATCRYAAQAGVAYASMTSTFATTGATAHSTVVNGLSSGQSYQFFVRCIDAGGNGNTDDFVITFSVPSSTPGSSTFGGVENPLSQGGMWDSPGSWADLQVNNGAYAVGLNAQGRLVTPAVAANQYSEITYDQDPGAGSSWVGVGTRIQSATNGSGYLAIAYAGEVRLYRTDDTGSLNFTLLASASASIGTAPRRLRLESQGNTHRVFFNGAQLINHTATGTTYSSGQPGISASVFGGPTVKILTFVGEAL